METVESADGTTIAYQRSGQGPALVLVVGAFCDSSSSASLAAALGGSFTVYEYDRRGRGDSGDTAPYSTEREVADLRAVVAVAGGTPFAFGHSSGGALVLEAAAAGVPMSKLVSYEAPYTTSDGSLAPFADELDALIADGKRGEAAERFLRLTGAPPEAVEGMKSSPYWPRMEGLAHTLPYDVRLCNGGAVPAARLARIASPTLALAGGDSPAWAHDSVASIAAAAPDGHYRVLDGQTHGVADEVLVPVLKEFFL